MTKHLIDSMSYVMWESDLIATRITLALAELFWAVMLLWPGNTFGRQTYEVMSHVMTEEAWAFVLLLSGATQISIVVLGQYSSAFARYFAAWNAAIWVFIVVSMLISVYPPPAAIGGEIALALWIWLRPLFLLEGYRRAFRTK